MFKRVRLGEAYKNDEVREADVQCSSYAECRCKGKLRWNVDAALEVHPDIEFILEP